MDRSLARAVDCEINFDEIEAEFCTEWLTEMVNPNYTLHAYFGDNGGDGEMKLKQD